MNIENNYLLIHKISVKVYVRIVQTFSTCKNKVVQVTFDTFVT